MSNPGLSPRPEPEPETEFTPGIEKFTSGTIGIFEMQPFGTLNQSSPVQNTFYTILEATNCMLYDVGVNIEDTNETLQVRITIDGVVFSPASFGATHSTEYNAFTSTNAITRDVLIRIETIGTIHYTKLMLQGKSVKVEVAKTTNAGSGNLTGVAMWGRASYAR